MQFVILCGGLGSRAQSFSKGKPKSMIEFKGKPFIDYSISNLISQGISRFVLCVGKGGESIVEYCEKHFATVGELARKLDVRLSMHPGQFTVLASDNPDIVNRSIEEFEYHVDVARWMGYGRQYQDFKINVHIAGRKGPAGILDAYPRLSPEARNTITIENDEMSWGIEASLELRDKLALVLDIHHHWVKTGEYIQPTDDRFSRIIDSWRGVRPVIHYSVSREDLLVGHDENTLPNMEELLEQGFKKAKLRAHSDYMWNNAVNDWALSFREFADIMVESKAKNLASIKLLEHKSR